MNKKKITAVVLSIALIAFVLCGSVLAKYIISADRESPVSAADFYLDSNFLKDASNNASYNISGSSVEVVMKNFVSAEKCSSSNITYNVSVSNGTANGSSSLTGLTITGGSNNTSSFTVAPANASSPVVVTVTSTLPFSKSLTASFNFISDVDPDLPTYLIEDYSGSDYATLRIMAGSTNLSNSAFSIALDTSKYSLDPTNPYVVGATESGGSYNLSSLVPAHSTAVIYIFKSDPTDDISCAETLVDTTISIG